MVAYQALLSDPRNVARVRAGRQDVERAGGRLQLAPPGPTGLVVVLLELPEGQRPEAFFPGLPFYPL